MIAWCKSLLRKFRPTGGVESTSALPDDPDAEIREVFLAELNDVAQSLKRACAEWRANPADQAALKTIRRGFHTLKGSAPLVGASALSEFSRHLEKLAIQLLEKPLPVTPDILNTVEQAIGLLPAFAISIRDARPPPPMVRALGHRAQRFLE